MQEAFRGVLACQGPGNRSLPGKARGFRVQDTVERHGGVDVVKEKIVQWEQENPASNGRQMIDDFRLFGGYSDAVVRVDHLQRGSGPPEWSTFRATTTLLSQRAKSSPLWSRLFPGIRIGRRLARIARVLWVKPVRRQPRVFPRARRGGAPHERVLVE